MKLRATFYPPLWAALLATIPGNFASGQQPSVGKTPYQIHCVVLMGEHRFLSTEQFQDQFPRELSQRTKLALGDLVRVSTATSHDLAETIRRIGLDAAIDGHDEFSSRRTWFFVLTVHAGQFELQGRFFDGLTGLAGPKSTTVTTADRSRLAALAAGMIADRFAYVGTAKSIKGDAVDLAIVGGELAGPEIPRGAAFALCRITRESGELRARKLPWAALEAVGTPANGIVPCQFWRRFVDDAIGSADSTAYRALLLPTISAPLRLRVIDRDTAQPIGGIAVSIRSKGRDFELITDAAGAATTPETVSGFAVVKLARGSAAIAQFPATIVDERPILCEISARDDADDSAGLEIRKMQLGRRMIETLRIVDQRFTEQQVLLNQSLESSLEFAQKTLKLLDDEIAAIRAERDEIRLLDLKLHPGKKHPDDGEKRLLLLNQFHEATNKSIDGINKAIKEREQQNEKQRQAAKLVEQGSLLESQSQFDEALAQYKKAAELLPNSAKIGEMIAKLETDWKPKDETHVAARRFLIATWPKLEPDALKQNVPLAKKHLEICKEKNDRLTPKRFAVTNVEHFSKLSKIAEQLRKSRLAEDQQRLLAWKEVFNSLQELTARANELSQPVVSKKKGES